MKMAKKKVELTRKKVDTVCVLLNHAMTVTPGYPCVHPPWADDDAMKHAGFDNTEGFFEESYLLGIINEWAELKRNKMDVDRFFDNVRRAQTVGELSDEIDHHVLGDGPQGIAMEGGITGNIEQRIPSYENPPPPPPK